MIPDFNKPDNIYNENSRKIYPFKGINYTAEEINRLLSAIDKKADINMVRDGLSAYEVAVANGYKGTVEQWLQSLRGPRGEALQYQDLTASEKEELKEPAYKAAEEVKGSTDKLLRDTEAKVDEVLAKGDAASEAATKANEAANSATTAAGKANEATGKVNTAVDNATAATGNANAAADKANAAADKATNEGLFKTPQDLSEEEQGQVKRNLGIEDLVASMETQTIDNFSETVNATTSTKSVDNIILPSIDFAIVDLGSTDGRELPNAPTMSVILAKVADGSRVKMQGYLKTSHEEYNIQVVSGSAEKDALNVGIITDIETTYKIFQIRYLSSFDGGKFKGSYEELSQLQAAYPTAGNGSYAFVGNPRHLYEWVTNTWTDRGEFITNVDQAIDAQSERAISNKAVSAKFTELENNNGLYYKESSSIIGDGNRVEIILNDDIEVIKLFNVSLEKASEFNFNLTYYYIFSDGESEYLSISPQEINNGGFSLFMPKDRQLISLVFYTSISISSDIYSIEYSVFYKNSPSTKEATNNVTSNNLLKGTRNKLDEVYKGSVITFNYNEEGFWTRTSYSLRKDTTYLAKILKATIPLNITRLYRSDGGRNLLCSLYSDRYSEFSLSVDTINLEVINEYATNRNGVIEVLILDKSSIEVIQGDLNEITNTLGSTKNDVDDLKERVSTSERELEAKISVIPPNSVNEDMLTESVRAKLNNTSSGTPEGLFPDDKDLTILNNKLVFANKLVGSGQKVLFLRPDDTGQFIINTSTFSEENCIYVIRDRFTIEDELEIYLPANSILYFAGGFIEGGILIGNNSQIVSYPQFIFTSKIKGAWCNKWIVDWFYDCSIDASIAIKKGLENMASIGLSLRDGAAFVENVPELTFTAKEYLCKTQIDLREIYSGFNASAVVKLGGVSESTVIKSEVGFEAHTETKYLFEYKKPTGLNTIGINISVHDIKFIAKRFEDWHTFSNTGCFNLGGSGEPGEEYPEWINNCRFYNCSFRFFYQAVNIEQAFWTRIISCDFFYCNNMLRLTTSNSSTLINNVFRGSNVKGVEIVDGTGMQISGNSFDQHVVALELSGRCNSVSIIGNYFEAQSGTVQCTELVLGTSDSDSFIQMLVKANLGLFFTTAFNDDGIYYHKGIKVHGNFEYCDIDGVLDIIKMTGKGNKGIVSVFGTDSTDSINGVFEEMIHANVIYT